MTTAILSHWARLGGARSPVGAVAGRERAVPGGRVQDFTRGRIYWSSTTRAHAVHGSIGRRYDGLGGPGGLLGLPTTDETATTGGRVSRFQHGSIYWSAGTGAHPVAGAVGRRYEALGGPRSPLGLPTGAETAAPGHRVARFTGGAIYWSRATGAHAVSGTIGRRYEALGGPRSALGLPTTDETATGTGRVSRFQHGSITWSAGGGTRVTVDRPLSAAEDFALHLLRRTTYGITPELQTEVKALGTTAWLERQLAPAGIDDRACDAALTRYPLAFADPPALHAKLSYGAWDGMWQLGHATLTRACFSRRQLLEVMVEFWSNHLNVTCPSSEVWSGKPWDDAHVIRAHALGRFDDMLVASSRSPAMLQYLSNADSRGSAPNENYGRELLELHTVGREAGYTQAEVVSCARALTGLSTWNPWNGGTPASYGTFRYRPEWRYTGTVSVLGWSHANADRTQGVAVAESLVRHLARHPRTAARLARKLAVRFVSDSPPQALVDRLAEVYLAHDTAVAPVLRALFASPEFAGSAGEKYRRPYEDLVATVRTLGLAPAADAETDGIAGLYWRLWDMGHAPLAWHPPNGYPDVAAAWTGAGTVLGRWNAHVGIVGGWWRKGIAYPADLRAALLPQVPGTRAELVDALAARLLPGTPLPTAQRDALVTFLGGPGPVGGPDTTWLFAPLVALVLDSPVWSTR